MGKRSGDWTWSSPVASLSLWSLAQGRPIVDVEGEAELTTVDLEEDAERKPYPRWAKVS